MARDPHVIGRVRWPRRRKGRLGHRPGRPVAGPAALRYASQELRGRSVVVAQEPSKLLGRVRFPSPALSSEHHGEWRSLVAHPAGGRAVAGSNPVSPITGPVGTPSARPGLFVPQTRMPIGNHGAQQARNAVAVEAPQMVVSGRSSHAASHETDVTSAVVRVVRCPCGLGYLRAATRPDVASSRAHLLGGARRRTDSRRRGRPALACRMRATGRRAAP